MDLTRHVDELQRQLAIVAAAGGDEARELADRLTAPLDAAARLVLLEALSTAAGEISAELAPGSVDVRLRAGEPQFVVTPAAPPDPVEPAGTAGATPSLSTGSAGSSPAATVDVESGATARTTLRLPDHFKAQVEAAAARDGVSVNTWLVRAVAAGLGQTAGGPAVQARSDPRANRHTSEPRRR